ncbi:hypothetical protein [Hyalangium sp.]|nr:hypothetical protein [Hyalangium sp.]
MFPLADEHYPVLVDLLEPQVRLELEGLLQDITHGREDLMQAHAR